MIPGGPATLRVEGAVPPTSGLRAGAVLTVSVRGTTEAPFLNLAATRVPLPANGAILPGQQVRVEILPGALRQGIQVTPIVVDEVPMPRMPGIEDLIAPVLARFGAESVATAARLVPPALPLGPQQLHQLLALFFEESHVAEDLRQLAAILSRAAEHIPELNGAAQFFAARAGMLAPQAAKDWRSLLTRSTGDHALEARIAAAIADGRISDLPGLLQDNLRAQLALLRGNRALASQIGADGQQHEFDDLLARLSDRLSGGELQKIRALGQAYHFIELPAAPESGFQRGQIHFFAEGEGGEAGRREHRVVLDLELSQTGPLWIVLQATREQCSCRFQSARPEVCAAIEEGSEEIAASLRAAGYGHAQVRATAWDGDRIAGVAGLMDGLAGFRVEA